MWWLLLGLWGCVPVLTSPPDTSSVGETGEAETWEAPDNTWPVNEPPADLEGEGLDEGQVAPDFRMTDQYGDTVSLWQFYGMVVVLDFSTMWCSVCREIAQDVEETWEDYESEGFTYISILAEDLEGAVPEVSDLQEWADYYGITQPVLSDGEGYTEQVVTDDAFPRVLVLDREMKVHESEVNPVSDANIRAVVEEIL